MEAGFRFAPKTKLAADLPISEVDFAFAPRKTQHDAVFCSATKRRQRRICPIIAVNGGFANIPTKRKLAADLPPKSAASRGFHTDLSIVAFCHALLFGQRHSPK